MNTVSRILITVLLATASLTTAVTVWADDPETIVDFMVLCTSEGQICDPSHSIEIGIETSSFLQVQYSVPPSHCSSVRIIVSVDGSTKVTTGFFGWLGASGPFAELPLSTGVLDLGPESPGTHVLTIQGEGQQGGCNTGQLESWGGSLRILTSVSPECNGALATIVGTDGPDALIGTVGPDVIVGLGGDDTILGGGGRDTICGGQGDDIINGGSGADWVSGGQGSDMVRGGLGRDRLLGGPGNDVLRGGKGGDRLWGGSGHDVLDGGPGRDKLFGEGGDDMIAGRGGNDTIKCGPGVDFADGGPHEDTALADCEFQTGIP